MLYYLSLLTFYVLFDFLSSSLAKPNSKKKGKKERQISARDWRWDLKQTEIPAMLRATTWKASSNALLRGSSCSTCRRFLYSVAKSSCPVVRSSLALTARRPLAVIDSVSDGRRRYAVAAEETDRGVVSYSFRSIPMEWRGKREIRRGEKINQREKEKSKENGRGLTGGIGRTALHCGAVLPSLGSQRFFSPGQYCQLYR